ncbi:hypothetical protein ACFO3D_14520 [Virgibacillus kekensis]|uniref:DUF2651 domain-containing protein n=1 Tax=Virgibacillus kekensis TaxID=202261 RepID=A0ABV9DKP1_9BACI
MGITVMFIILSTVTPFIFLFLKKRFLAVLQSVLLIGMWLYFVQIMFIEVTALFSMTWIMFYASLLLSVVGWVLLIIDLVKRQR